MGICIWYVRMHVGLLLYYLAAGVGALMYRSHGGIGYFMSHAWTVLKLALDIVISGRAIDVRHHRILWMHIISILVLDVYAIVDLLY